MNRFGLHSTISFGPDALDALADLGAARVLLVTDPMIGAMSPMRRVRERLGNATVEVFDAVSPNPTLQVVAAGVRAFLHASPDAVVALGGGSVIDTAKAVYKIALEHGATPSCGLVAIPTTSGSGSEVTSFSVISDERTHHKHALVSTDMVPRLAVLDPTAVLTVPPAVTADTGMDVATHALEAYASVNASDFSDAVAEKAIQLVREFLPRAVADGSDAVARERMHNASCLAGIAFENAGLGICHSLAHAVGGQFDVPHGRLNAVLLPHVLTFNAGDIGFGASGLTATAHRYAHLGHLLGLGGSSDRNLALGLIEEVRRLNATIGIPSTMTALGIKRPHYLAALDAMAEAAAEDGCSATNPRRASVADFRGILAAVA